jgi:sporulation protein YlmC with PRC-barrel domain
MSLHRYASLALALTLTLAACASASQNTSPTAAPATGAVSATDTPGAGGQTAQPPAQGTVAPIPTGKPPQSEAAEIRPPERRAELTRLTNLLQFQVVGLNNASLGKISDYIVNTCETYLIYLVLDPASNLQLAAGSKLVVPFEAVTINSGVLDAQAKAIIVQLSPDQLKAAPAATGAPKLLPTNTWEDSVRAYWQQVVRVGKLSSNCNTGSGTTQKIAYATQLIGAQLKDGNGLLVGAVQEGIVAPESGKMDFYVITLKDNAGLLLMPLAKTNIPTDALQPGAKIELVLLADPAKLAGAPHITSIDQAADPAAQSAARGYWGQ